MKLPDFLIIGAMKAGTTSLYRDIEPNPAIFMSLDKEPGDLARDEVLAPKGRARYARHFEKARPEQVCGEASTIYSQIPDHPGVPRRALEVIGPGVKVIYMVRDPVAQIISHHAHVTLARGLHEPIDRAVRERPRFVSYCRYAMQIEPWIEALGRDHVLIVPFERYVAGRAATVDDVSRFLGVPPRGDLVQADAVYNASADKPLPRGAGGMLVRSPLYRRAVRPMLSSRLRERLRRAFLPRAKERPAPPSPETVEWIREQVRDDAERLRRIMNLDEPLWNLGQRA